MTSCASTWNAGVSCCRNSLNLSKSRVLALAVLLLASCLFELLLLGRRVGAAVALLHKNRCDTGSVGALALLKLLKIKKRFARKHNENSTRIVQNLHKLIVFRKLKTDL